MAQIKKRLCPKSAADIALKNRLYVSGWLLSRTLKHIRKYNYCNSIILAYEHGIPVGVALRNAHNSPIQVFVKKSYRHKGIGTKLVKSLQKELGIVQAAYGIAGSGEFYKKVGITIE